MCFTEPMHVRKGREMQKRKKEKEELERVFLKNSMTEVFVQRMAHRSLEEKKRQVVVALWVCFIQYSVCHPLGHAALKKYSL